MTTSMHRLQISLPEPQLRYLAGRAGREGVSMAEVIRRLLAAAAAAESPQPTVESAVVEARPSYQIAPPPPRRDRPAPAGRPLSTPAPGSRPLG